MCAFSTAPSSIAAAGSQLRKMQMAGTDHRLKRHLLDTEGNGRRRMENFLLFILSSSSCTLVTSVVLLLRPLTAMP
jgi:hypothetical protein